MAERTFESQMARLEEIVRMLERGEAPLNESMKLFEEGTKLSASLGKLLDKAEQKVTVMQENMQGELSQSSRLRQRRKQNDVFRAVKGRYCAH